jgi:hypothetical protein
MMTTSYRAIVPSLASLGEQLLYPLAVGLKAGDHLTVDHQRGRGTAFPLIDQLVIGLRICLDILPFIGNTLVPKELLGRPAIPSTGLMVQQHLLH